MSSRILMATVAAIVLAVPAAAQDQEKPLNTSPEQAAQHPAQEQSGDTAETAAPDPAAQPPANAGEQPPVGGEQGLAGAAEEPTPPAEMTFIEVQDEA